MTHISHQMAKNPQITLVSGADQLCQTCPNRIGETGCNSDEKVLRYDAQVLERCGLSVGDVVTWDAFSALVAREILNVNRLEQVCQGCEWMHICLNIHRQEQNIV